MLESQTAFSGTVDDPAHGHWTRLPLSAPAAEVEPYLMSAPVAVAIAPPTGEIAALYVPDPPRSRAEVMAEALRNYAPPVRQERSA